MSLFSLGNSQVSRVVRYAVSVGIVSSQNFVRFFLSHTPIVQRIADSVLREVFPCIVACGLVENRYDNNYNNYLVEASYNNYLVRR